MQGGIADKITFNIKRKISENGLSVHGLEKKAGLKQSAIQNILYGKSKKPSLQLIQSIADALNCTVSELLEEDFIDPLGVKEGKLSLPQEPWNPDLYLDAFNAINSLSKRKKISLPRDTFLSCSDEVYAYSLKTGKHKADKHFAEWLVDRSSG